MLQPLALVCFASVGLAFAGSGPDQHGPIQHLKLSSVSGWTLDDFDGDSKIDLASSESAGHDARGFQQQLQIHLSTSRESSFLFSSRSARVRLTARDIDGDHDRDIVALEALSSELVAVWLNDGSGNFSKGDISLFPAAKETRLSISTISPESGLKLSIAILEERTQAALPRAVLLIPDTGARSIDAESSSFHREGGPSHPRDRSPPSNS